MCYFNSWHLDKMVQVKRKKKVAMDSLSTYVQVCMQMRKLRFLRKIAKTVNCAKKKTNPQLGLAILAKIAIFAIFRKNR